MGLGREQKDIMSFSMKDFIVPMFSILPDLMQFVVRTSWLSPGRGNCATSGDLIFHLVLVVPRRVPVSREGGGVVIKRLLSLILNPATTSPILWWK